ncbi:PaaI family thioesterase [Corynebacterium sp. 320]|uniref:PaaI family thioesterase n=1 Tax=Corynebacterium TaxID=1716 RepID=UPI00125CBC58|nr:MULTISPECIES: PaaI family thioesterase [Corynebacterium]KAB1503608.1 PaaI family thioesterase [Corynebacterium sp. 320]KAB1553291.1 PaaI family thioesterase [Corynebacterium sp. 321]KAB3527744.1 PaaI family thioesterase [Corynebacterium sp. 250]QNP92965.1 PaaI family thioesterase [Corynebacterium zhongnanshanii]
MAPSPDKAEVMKRFLELSTIASQRALDSSEIDEINQFTALAPTLDRTLGVTYVAIEPKKQVLRLEIDAKHLQPWGVTNGGVYASLGETAGSMASYIAAGSQSVVMGTSNETHFLRPSKAGDVIISTATPENLGRTTHLWRIEHVNEATGKVCALTFLKTAVMPKTRS